MYKRKVVLNKFIENEDFFKNTIYPNIEKYRKGDLKITLLDKNNNPIQNAEIKICQNSHAFSFGANIFMLDELETDEKNCQYKNHFKELFNMATLPFYWNTTEPEKGKTRYDKNCSKWYRRPSIDLCMEFCEENRIEPREHGLAYERMFPDWLSEKSVEDIKEELENRFSYISKRYADKIRTIEVTNEMNWGHESGKTKFYNQRDYVEWCFKTAEKYFKDNQLVINESTEEAWLDNCRSTDKYYSYIEANLLKGARIDAIGSQFHMFYKREDEIEKANYLYNPISLYEHMYLYSHLVNQLQITEVTIPAYSNEKEDEEIQAKLLEYLYTVWFSHPFAEQIIYWNLVDGYAYVPDPTPEAIRRTQGDMSVGENVYYGGLLRYDLSPKPAYYTLKNLIWSKWCTKESKISSENGECLFRGFYGDYKIDISLNGKTITENISLRKGCKNEFTFVI